jgi:hypothetical protein
MIEAMAQTLDDELHEYIVESGQQIISIFQNYLGYLRND